MSVLTVPVLKNILRFNHQNPFENKSELLSRIIYLVKHDGYPRCPKDQSKYYCPGYPIGFRAPASYHQCDYVTDECEKESFNFSSTLNLNKI